MRKTVLIVEPRPSTRSTLRRVLEGLDASILLHADTTRAAAEILEGVRVDIAFIDLGFSQEHGFHFINGIRQGLYCDNQRLPIIAVAEARTHLFQRARSAGIHGFLACPFSRAAVELQLRRVSQDPRPLNTTTTGERSDGRAGEKPACANTERPKPNPEGGAADETSLDDAFYLP